MLKFLQENCVKDMGTYWLLRRAGDSAIRLYDLSALSSKKLLRWKYMMAMLCYRYASQMDRNAQAQQAQQEANHHKYVCVCVCVCHVDTHTHPCAAARRRAMHGGGSCCSSA